MSIYVYVHVCIRVVNARFVTRWVGKSINFDDLCVSKKNEYYLKLSNPTVVQPFDKPIQYSPQSDERKKTWDLIS